MAHEAVAGLGTVAVVVLVDPAVGWVVVVDEAPEDADAAAWSAVRWAVQPVPARAATKTVVAMIRTGRMDSPNTTYFPGQQPKPSRSQRGHRSVSRPPRTGLDLVAILQVTKRPIP
jgi:hypothetical protein